MAFQLTPLGKILVDQNIWDERADTARHLDKIVRWLLDNHEQSEEVFHAYGSNISGAVIDILGYLCDCERAVTKIRDAIAGV